MFLLMLLFAPALAWVPTTTPMYTTTRTTMQMQSSTNDEDALPDITNPCWQNLLDDDCSMSTMYASSFIAGKWIKSMPCGEGIEDCDMPTALMTPETYPDSGMGRVDVMDFLHLKRATSLKKKQP